MPWHTCLICGAQYPDSPQPPAACLICTDDRQYVGVGGSGRQEWATTEELLHRGHRNVAHELEPGLVSISVEPKLGIGQQAILVRTGEGNLLWDCNPLLHPTLVAELTRQGGLQGIAISHPHFYGAMADWADAFDCPVYVHAKDAPWVTRPSERICFWTGDQLRVPLLPSITLHRMGGHFPGSSVLHWAGAADGKGRLLVGDTIFVTVDGYASFMYSVPNFLPLPADVVAGIRGRVERLPPFARLYGAFPQQQIDVDAQSVVLRSAERYCAILEHRDNREYV